MRKIGDGII